MRIDREKREIGKYALKGTDNNKEVKKTSETSFDKELDRNREGENQLRMKEILDEIDRINEKLKRSLNLNDLMLYKKTVKNFLLEAMKKAYLVKQQRGRNRRGRTLLITIDIIDAEVDRLIDGFIKKKTEAADTLAMLDKIRGMLVDLVI